MNGELIPVVSLEPDQVLDQHIGEGRVEVVLHITESFAHRRKALDNLTTTRHAIGSTSREIPFADGASPAMQFHILAHVVVE